MAKDNELVIKINGDIKGYQEALKATKQETKELQDTLNTIAKTGAIAFAGLIGVVTLTTAKFAEFDHGLRGVKTLLDESSFSAKTLDQGFQDLSKGALAALQDFPLTLQSINKSLFDIVSAGIPAANAIDVLGSTSRLAVAGLTDSAVATDAVTSALNAYGLSAKDAELVAAKFFTAQKFGKTTIAEMSQFFGRAASTAKEYGVSLDELLASIAAATAGGIKTAAAFSAIPAVMSNIAKPTAEATEEAGRLGIEFTSTALRAKGLTGFLNDLTTAQGFNKASIEKLFGSVEAQKLIFALTGEAADKYKQTLDALSDSQQVLSTFTAAYEEQSKSLKNQIIILKNNFDALAIVIGAKLAPLVSTLAGVMTNFLRFLQENPGLVSFISKMLIAGSATSGLITVAALAATVVLKLRASMIAAAIATKGLTFAVKGLIGSTGFGLLIAFLPEIFQAFKWLFDNSLDLILRYGRSVGNIAKGIGNILKGMFTLDADPIVKGFEQLKEALTDSAFKAKEAREKNVVSAKKEREDLKKIGKEKVEDAKTTGEKIIAADKKIIDTKLQNLKDENERIQAALNGIAKEQIAFLKRRQDIRKKAADAEKEQDKNRREAALENVKLLNQQLEKEEKEAAKKTAALQAEKDKKAAEKTALEREQAKQRLQALKDENEAIKANLSERSEEEINFLRRRQEIREQTREAEKIKNQEEKALALENIQLKNEELLAEEKKFFEERDALRAEQVEIEALLQEELDALSTEKRKALQQAELDDLRKTFETKEKIRSLAVKQEIIAQRKENQIFEEEEERHGKAIANFNAFFRREDVKGSEGTIRQLTRLQRSKNSTLSAIGKIAALTQIGIDTARGAIAAYTSLAGIPIVGPALGAAAAAAIIAYGAERTQDVQAAQAGGIVGGVGFGDRMPFLLEPGELITPRQNFEEVVNSVAIQREAQRGIEEGGAELTEVEEEPRELIIGFDSEEAADILTVRQNEQGFLGVSQRIV